jgi:peptidylprolyl isomerase
MIKKIMIGASIFTLLSSNLVAEEKKILSPGEIVKTAPASDWLTVSPQDLLVMKLKGGTVVMQLATDFAPLNTANFRTLAHEGFYDGLSMYRVIEGFVAQGGDSAEKKPLGGGIKNIKGEITSSTIAQKEFSTLELKDGYAGETGFVKGFAAGRSADKKQTWLTHCTGAVGIGRGDGPDSGGTEFYVVLGHATRYLDRNITLVGRVLSGMSALQKLQRTAELDKDQNIDQENPIISMSVMADLPIDQQVAYEVMDTSSVSFDMMMEARQNRPSSWFLETPNYVDVCAVYVPSRIKK